MDEIITALRENLDLQKRKLEDLKTWGDDTILIEAQNAVISELEKKIEALQGVTGK